MSKTITLEITIPKDVFKRLKLIAKNENKDVTDVIAFLLTYTAETYNPNRNKTGNNIGPNQG